MSTRALEGRVALITGSSRGIGRAIAIRFAEEGCRVVINCKSSLEAAEEAARQIESISPGASLVAQADVSREDAVESMVARAVGKFGRLDILVNNASLPGGLRFSQVSLADWQAMIDTTLTGAFLCAKAVVPHMLREGWGRIISIASTSGLTGGTSGAHYAAAKGGLISLTKAMSAELAPRGITVNSIAPSKIETEMLWQSLGEEGQKEELLSRIPVRRFGKPREIAALALFLASEEAGYITGETIVASGGYR